MDTGDDLADDVRYTRKQEVAAALRRHGVWRLDDVRRWVAKRASALVGNGPIATRTFRQLIGLGIE